MLGKGARVYEVETFFDKGMNDRFVVSDLFTDLFTGYGHWAIIEDKKNQHWSRRQTEKGPVAIQYRLNNYASFFYNMSYD